MFVKTFQFDEFEEEKFQNSDFPENFKWDIFWRFTNSLWVYPECSETSLNLSAKSASFLRPKTSFIIHASLTLERLQSYFLCLVE